MELYVYKWIGVSVMYIARQKQAECFDLVQISCHYHPFAAAYKLLTWLYGQSGSIYS